MVQTETIKTIRTSPKQDEEFEKAWTKFANAVLSRNPKALAELSSACIYCTHCVTNTPKEDSLFNDFRSKNPDAWYEKLNSEYCYIPINKFLSDDFELIFDSITTSKMLKASKISYHDDGHNKGLYKNNCIAKSSELKNSKLLEMFVKVIDYSSETEGLSKAFAFIQTKQGYRFCGYSTIP